MLLKLDQILLRLQPDFDVSERLVIRPKPLALKLFDPSKGGSAPIDLRLGCWFGVMRRNSLTHLDVVESSRDGDTHADTLKMHYVPFGRKFILHPRDFVLAVTFEWIRLPGKLAGYVIGRSSWGRRGLIIETAAGVHPGFTGCLTLELSNVGQVPIVLTPGIEICQLFVHQTLSGNNDGDKSIFVGRRHPVLGEIQLDDVAKALAKDAF